MITDSKCCTLSFFRGLNVVVVGVLVCVCSAWHPDTLPNAFKPEKDIHALPALHNHTYWPGVALIVKFCVNISFSGAVRILAASPRHHTQND